MRILVVDDEALISDILKRTLTKDGHSVIVADDGQFAYDALKKDAGFDLVITDRRMPRLTGPELLVKVRKDLGLVIPVICISGDNTTAELAELESLGFDAVLTKPWSSEQLKEVIEALQRPTSKLILSIEGSNADRVRIAELLADRYAVIFAGTIDEAIERIQIEAVESRSFDLVLTDRHLLGGSGGTLLARLHQCDATCPIVLISEVVWPGRASWFRLQGFADAMPKADMAAKLRPLIDRLLIK